MSSIISNSETGLRVTASGYLPLPCMYLFNDVSSDKTSAYTNNVVYGMKVNIPFPILWKNFAVNIGLESPGSLFSVGLFTLSGSRLVSSGAQSGATPGPLVSTLTSPYMVQPGACLYCWTANDINLGISQSVGIDFPWCAAIRALGSTYEFTAANASVGGALPATLGVLTGTTLDSALGNGPPLVLIYP